MPPIIISRPASMRLAIAISPSRDSSSTLPISRRYMRTGSSVPETSLSDRLPAARPSSSASSPFSSLSALSTTDTPISERVDITSSICSEVKSSAGRAAFSSSWVTKPRSLPILRSVLIVCWAASVFAASTAASAELTSGSACLFAFAAIEFNCLRDLRHCLVTRGKVATSIINASPAIHHARACCIHRGGRVAVRPARLCLPAIAPRRNQRPAGRDHFGVWTVVENTPDFPLTRFKSSSSCRLASSLEREAGSHPSRALISSPDSAATCSVKSKPCK